MIWFKDLTATYLPGWVFNVAFIFHGEEAVLAAGFLFTVHFFNNHWRPDKFPLDISDVYRPHAARRVQARARH